MSTVREGLRLSVGTFTRLPSGTVTLDAPTARTALLLAPVAVLPLAVLVGLVAAGVEVGLPPFVAAGLVLLVLAHGSRGLHLDGLADLADALAAGWDRERALEVMRRGDVGPTGAVALVLTLLLQAAAITDLLRGGWRGGLLVAVAVVLSRAVCAQLCTTGTRPASGSRMGAVFVGSVPSAAALVLTVATVALLLVGAVPTLMQLTEAGLLRGITLVGISGALGALAAIAVRDRAVRTLGGVNGDVLGAGIEIALTTVLVVLTLAW